ncbi:MAG: AraC family transcriptional regulator [Vallitaleaceae bacterium]|nr:AraC family transcriptional regulator [Vallitaleaceae bacterium]
MEQQYSEKGYLDQGLLFFYLSDQQEMQFNYHYHNFHKCLIVLQGDVEYTIEGRDYHLSGPDVLWIPPKEAHKLRVSGKTIYERFVIYLSPQFLELLSTSLHENLKSIGTTDSNCLHLEEKFHQELLANTEKMIGLIRKQSSRDRSKHDNSKQDSSKQDQESRVFEELELRSIFFLWLKEYYAVRTKKEKGSRTDKKEYSKEVGQALEFIERNYSNPKLSIEQIAKELHISKFHLMRKFKEALGITMHQYINKERLMKARTLMKEGNSPSDIAYMVGFSDYTSFARAFKKFYSHSPKKFLRLCDIMVIGSEG